MEHVGTHIMMALMESATAIDAAVVFICVICALLGFWTGFVWQIVRLVSWLFAVWGAGLFYTPVARMIGFGLGKEVRQFIAFIALFAIILLTCYLIAHLISKMVEALQLSLADRIAGGFLGVFKGLCLCGVISLAVLHFLNPESALSQMFARSYLAILSAKGVAILWMLLPLRSAF